MYFILLTNQLLAILWHWQPYDQLISRSISFSFYRMCLVLSLSFIPIIMGFPRQNFTFLRFFLFLFWPFPVCPVLKPKYAYFHENYTCTFTFNHNFFFQCPSNEIHYDSLQNKVFTIWQKQLREHLNGRKIHCVCIWEQRYQSNTQYFLFCQKWNTKSREHPHLNALFLLENASGEASLINI